MSMILRGYDNAIGGNQPPRGLGRDAHRICEAEEPGIVLLLHGQQSCPSDVWKDWIGYHKLTIELTRAAPVSYDMKPKRHRGVE